MLIPHEFPWQLSNLARIVVDEKLYFLIRFPLLSDPIRVSSPILFLSLFLLSFLVFLALPQQPVRSAWRSLRNHKQAFLGGMVALELLLLTLIPAEPDFVRDGSTVVSFLIAGSLAFLLVAIGMSPFIRSFPGNRRISAAIERGFDGLKTLFLFSSPIVFVGILAAIHFVLANAASYFLFEHIPHVQDSIAQLFHGKIFAKGMLTAPAPAYPEFFEFLHVIIRDGKWYSQYPPGHSILLTIGTLIGAPWIVNPLFGSLNILLMYLLGKELYGETVGRLSALLSFLSPFLFFMSSEFMNHTTALSFLLVFILFFAKSLKSGRFLHGALAGGALGWLINIRPYSAAALSAPFLVYGLFVALRRFRELRPAISGFILLSALFLAVLLLFNTLTNGHPFLFGFQVLWGNQVNPGFGPGAWGDPHTPLRGLHQMLSNFNGVNKYLFELPVPSLLLVVLLFFTGARDRWDLLFVMGFFALAIAYFFYWFQDWCFGPRFLFEGAALLILLSARAIDRFPIFWNEALRLPASRRSLRIASFTGLALLFSVGFAANIPAHLRHYGSSYWGVNAEVLNAVRERGITRAVVFTRSYYAGVFPANDPLLGGDVIYATDRGPNNKLLLDLFPGFSAYVARGPELKPLMAD